MGLRFGAHRSCSLFGSVAALLERVHRWQASSRRRRSGRWLRRRRCRRIIAVLLLLLPFLLELLLLLHPGLDRLLPLVGIIGVSERAAEISLLFRLRLECFPDNR
jgi:hypothetical protein